MRFLASSNTRGLIALAWGLLVSLPVYVALYTESWKFFFYYLAIMWTMKLTVDSQDILDRLWENHIEHPNNL